MTRKEMIDRLVIPFTPEQATALLDVFSGIAPVPGPIDDHANVQVLYYLRGADLTSTEDQPFTKVGQWTGGIVSQVFSTNGSATPTSCAGGIYGGAGKTAPTVVASTQSWAAMTTDKRVVNATLGTQQFQVNGNLYLSLTTPSSAPATADFYIFGVSVNEVG